MSSGNWALTTFLPIWPCFCRSAVQPAGKGSAVRKTACKMTGFFMALLLVALPLAGCSCSWQGAESASSQASSAASASAGASSASASSDAASGAPSGDVDAEEGSGESIEEAPSSGDSSSSNQGGGPNSSWAEAPSAPSGGDSGSGSSEPQPAAHEHSWEWVPQWVDIVHREAYDEPVYRWATWCYKCDVEVAKSHNEEMLLKGEKGHTLTDLKVLDHYKHVEAETHQEDHGYYRCSTCGETY